MSNVLNTIIANQPIKKPEKQATIPAFTFDSEGKIKPMQDKGRLLPSRIFGSPVDYAHDLKQDIVSIGKAAKGKANDHELGRINDLAMKIGSLGLAAYLFTKNTSPSTKIKEFIGFGTFFASMALWPKLAIQAPIKARTGVDIHQKYIDSQGRKKMLFQDPQYVLTDLYSKEDLEKMGDKLGVSKDLPDRDNFIKQRAQKTALQGNTLWMMTAGIASPIMSALACNVLEKPLSDVIETRALQKTKAAVDSGNFQSIWDKLKQKVAISSFNKYIDKNASKKLDAKMIGEIASKFGVQANSKPIQDAIEIELSKLNGLTFDRDFVQRALQGKVPESVFTSLADSQVLDSAISKKSYTGIADILAKSVGKTQKEQRELSKTFAKTLEKASKESSVRTVFEGSSKIKDLFAQITEFSANKGVLDRYITARVGDQADTYIANQWGKVSGSLIKSLKLNGKELKALSQGKMDVLTDKLAKLASNEAEFDKVVKQLMSLIDDYETMTSKGEFLSTVESKSKEICQKASQQLRRQDFVSLADEITGKVSKKVGEGVVDQLKVGTVEKGINLATAERISGAKSSFYRLIQTLDLSKKIKDGTLKTQLTDLLKKAGQTTDDATIDKLTKVCKKVLMDATITDHVEKFKSLGFELSKDEFKVVMKVLFDSDVDTTIAQSLERTMGASSSEKMMRAMNAYKKEFMSKVANWRNGMTTDHSRRVVEELAATAGADGKQRANLVGKSVSSLVKETAQKTYNSNKWLKIFGGTMVALTAVTLAAGLAIGRKGKTEKEVEAQSKVNG